MATVARAKADDRWPHAGAGTDAKARADTAAATTNNPDLETSTDTKPEPCVRTSP